MFLSVGAEYDQQALSGISQRFMRDEVLAEWSQKEGHPVLKVHCHVSGGLILGNAAWRLSIFRHHMRQVLEALRYGDRARFEQSPELDKADIEVHFHSSRKKYNIVESWGKAGEYRQK
jgi:proteinaceous RNase P